MRTWLKAPPARRHEKAILAAMAKANMAGMREAIAGAQDEMRDDVLAAGLGFRLAGTLRTKVYPAGAGESMAPGAIVYARPGKPGGRSAPSILGFYEKGSPITPALGAGLAIPTEHVPIGRRVPLSPREVEARFKRKLARVRLPSGNIGLFLRLRSGKGVKSVLMFVIVRNVDGRKRLDLAGVFRRWGDRFGALAAARFEYKG